MPWGIDIRNAFGHVLISSDVSSLHCREAIYGSTDSGVTQFENFAGPGYALEGRHIHKYSVPSATAPLVFIKPSDTFRFYGLLREYAQGGSWHIEVVQGGGDSAPPQVFAFLPPAEVVASGSDYGIAAYLADGSSETFNSKKRPLAILETVQGEPPLYPMSSIEVYGAWFYYGARPTTSTMVVNGENVGWVIADGPCPVSTPDMEFACTPGGYDFEGGGYIAGVINARTKAVPPNLETTYHYFGDQTMDYPLTPTQYTSVARGSAVSASDLMFATPCLAQAVYERVKRGFKSSSGYLSSQDHYSTSQWWAMYHQGVRLTGAAVEFGWCLYRAGYQYSAQWESGGWFGGSGGSTLSGAAPYTRKTINLGQTAVILADARPYL